MATNTAVESTNQTGLSGKTTIENAVIAKIAGIAARQVKGVYALGRGAARGVGAVREAVAGTYLSQGISVEVGEKQVAVDVSLVAEYPVPLQQVAGDVRQAIYDAVRNLVGMDVAEVNVTVNDVHMPGESSDEDQQPSQSRAQ